MLAAVTQVTHYLAMSISLWMAFHLFARGYPNRITLRAVLALLAIAVFFLDTYNHNHLFAHNSGPFRAALLVIALDCWYSVTFALLSPNSQTRYRRMEIAIYLLGAASVLSLVFSGGEPMPDANNLHTARLDGNLTNVVYGAAQIAAAAGTLFNLMIHDQIRKTTEGRYYLYASSLLVLSLMYGIISLMSPASFPRVIEDGLVFGGIFLLGLSVARHQSLVERRTIWQDFPIAMLGMTVIVSFYLVICVLLGIPSAYWATLTGLIITTHSMYDLGREAVERWRAREENRLRRKPRLQTDSNDDALRLHLDGRLALLLRALNAAEGLIAIPQNDKLTAVSSRGALPVDSELPVVSAANEGVFRIDETLPPLLWASQSFEGMQPIALVAIGRPRAKLAYSSGELDLLEEFTEDIGTLTSISMAGKAASKPEADRILSEPILPQESDDFVKTVEEALRHFGDSLFLGQSPLADQVGISGDSHIERGKQVQSLLREAIQSLRPQGERPSEPLPREWYNHVVLHDAYIKGVPNREVIARLYVSEGTFHRIRRHAARGVARYLAEKKRTEN